VPSWWCPEAARASGSPRPPGLGERPHARPCGEGPQPAPRGGAPSGHHGGRPGCGPAATAPPSHALRAASRPARGPAAPPASRAPGLRPRDHTSVQAPDAGGCDGP
jgi:hypothetical protein